MHTKKIIPVGWLCPLQECPPGHFIVPQYPDMLCFKSEYGMTDHSSQAFNCAGEYIMTKEDELVQPVEMIVEDEEI